MWRYCTAGFICTRAIASERKGCMRHAVCGTFLPVAIPLHVYGMRFSSGLSARQKQKHPFRSDRTHMHATATCLDGASRKPFINHNNLKHGMNSIANADSPRFERQIEDHYLFPDSICSVLSDLAEGLILLTMPCGRMEMVGVILTTCARRPQQWTLGKFQERLSSA